MYYETLVQINAPAERIWAEMIDVDRWPQWTPSMTQAERLDSGSFRLGSQARIKQPKLMPLVWTVVEFEAGRRFRWVSRAGGVVSDAEHRLDAEEGGPATVSLSVRQTGPMAWFAAIFYGGLTRRYVNVEAEGLKRHCEAGP
jgi:uncharacterized membrane protein